MLYTPEALAKAHYVPPYSAVIATVALVVAFLALVSSVFLQPYIARRFHAHHRGRLPMRTATGQPERDREDLGRLPHMTHSRIVALPREAGKPLHDVWEDGTHIGEFPDWEATSAFLTGYLGSPT